METPVPKRLVLRGVLAASLLTVPLLLSAGAGAVQEKEITIGEYAVPDDVMCKLREQWLEKIGATYPAGSWAPLKMELTDEQLALLGLPDRAWLNAHRFDEPTAVFPDGTTTTATLPPVAAYAGAGCFGIRPGAWVLLISGASIGWCSLAHVYGSPGSYEISTAGHCGVVGQRATVIAAFGNWGVPVLLDFGNFVKSTDGGIGNDWGLISIKPEYQHLVSPTMCWFGGPLGMYTKTGATVSLKWGRFGSIPGVSTNPDPFLAQTIGHYGHGTGLGQGVGTGRVGEALYWASTYFTFFGAISPGDSGSGSNALGGDAIGQVNEAAGINTHIYVDGLQLFKTGTGYLAGTRATAVQGTLALGQIVPYPAPVPGAP